jgi:hypothetical protein
MVGLLVGTWQVGKQTCWAVLPCLDGYGQTVRLQCTHINAWLCSALPLNTGECIVTLRLATILDLTAPCMNT